MIANFFHKLRTVYLYPIVGFFVTLVLIIVLTIYFSANLITQSQQKFDSQANEVSNTINANFSIYVNFLKDVQGLFASSDNVDRSEFSTFIKNIDFVNRYPGITLIAFSKKVSLDERQPFFDSLNNDPLLFANGTTKYIPNNEVVKDTYFLLDYAEPYDENTNFGFDSSASPERLPYIMKAIDENQPEMTDKIALTGANSGQFGFSIYLPIYKPDSVINTVEERRANATGVIIGSFRVNNVFGKIFENKDFFKELSLKIYTDGNKNEDLKLFDSNFTVTSQQKLQTTKIQAIAGKNWILDFEAANGFGLSTTENSVPVFTFIAGFVFSVLVGVFLYFLSKSQVKAIEIADQIKLKLQESEAQLSTILQSVDIIVYAINTKGIFTLSQGKGLEDLGLKPHELEGKSVFEVYKDYPAIVNQMKKAIGGEPIREIIKVQGITLESRITPIFDSNKKVISVVGISNNVTTREAASEKLKAKTDELERLNKIMINRELKMIELKEQLKLKDNSK